MRFDSSRMAVTLAVIRPFLGPVMLVGGIGLEVLGWYGVSGQSVEARQLPYLASASIPGAALIVGGAILAAGWSADRSSGETDRRVAELHALLVEVVQEEQPVVEGLVALPGGTTFHRPSCALVAGKPGAEVVGDAEIRERGLRPCPVCEPERG